eukprot:scaffold16091_cov132-Skeletonema_dohrnii-CCMP3373.AAC.2
MIIECKELLDAEERSILAHSSHPSSPSHMTSMSYSITADPKTFNAQVQELRMLDFSAYCDEGHKDLKTTADVPIGANSCNAVELFPVVCTETPSFRHNNVERIEIYSPYTST